MNHPLPSILLIPSLVILSSCQHNMNDVVNIKIKILKISFNEDIYDNGQTIAYEEIICERINDARKKNIIIVNYDYNRMKTIKENQQIEIGIRKTALDSNKNIIKMNELVYIKPLRP